ncbi:MAG: TetR/AcrR family transcriptional regulator [Chloroflexi bacterium]|nr:TetR/AcrR family transcriptional regulator [Chloroflexota bacterium]
MPKVTEAHLEARRHQILQGAAVCFAHKGFHQCTMDDICRQAQLSPGAVYRYFPSKEEIIVAMAEEGRQRSLALIEGAQERGDTSAVLDELANAFFGMLEDAQACALDIELSAEALRSPAVMEMGRRSLHIVRGAFAEIVRAAQERGEINRALDPDGVATVMISFYQGLILQKAADPDVDVWKYVAAMKAMMKGTFWTGEKQKGSE